MKNRETRLFVGAACLFACAILVGCGGGEIPPDVRKQDSNMRGLAVAYGQFMSQNRGRPPRNEEQFRAYIEKEFSDRLEQFEAASVDDLFVSPRDGQPYVVLYGKNSSQVVAYEQEGVDGKRFIANNLGGAEEWEEQKLFDAVPDAAP